MAYSLFDLIKFHAILEKQNPSFKKFYTGGLTNKEVFGLINVLDSSGDFKHYQVYKQFIDYAQYKFYCESELLSFGSLLLRNESLEQPTVREWMHKNKFIYQEKSYGFSIRR